MTNLTDLFTSREFQDAVDAKHIRTQVHPTEDLIIANYTELAVFMRAWTPVTLNCRGLIYNSLGHIQARPMRKFFNHGQPGAPVIPLDDPVEVTDKLDGSLGILYREPRSGRLSIATRGSFTSEQAKHATALLRTRYRSWEPDPDMTYLFEIIYPGNRIVVDYGQLDDLVLLGVTSMETGTVYGPDGESRLFGQKPWPGPRAEAFPYRTYRDALAAAPRPNREGLVVHHRATGERVKIKQEDYIELHRLVTGLSARRIHECMVSGQTLEQIIAPLPDEFHDWVTDVYHGIQDVVRRDTERVETAWRRVVAGCEERDEAWPAHASMCTPGSQPSAALTRDHRKLFAELAKREPNSWALFLKLEGRDYTARLLANAQPEGDLTPAGRTFSEATA